MNIIQQKIHTFRITDRFLDLILLFFSARIALIFERIYHGKNWGGLDPQSFNFYSLILIFSVWLILIQIFESEQLYRRIHIWDIIRNTTLISFIGVTSTITLDFLLKTELFHRVTILFFGIISFILLLIKRGGMKYLLSTIRKEGLDPKNILIIGSYKRAERLIHEFQYHTEYGLRIRSILDPDPKRVGQPVDGMVVSGDMTKFKQNIKEMEIDEVFFALDLKTIPNIHEIFSYLDTIGVSYHMMINESIHSYADRDLTILPVTSSYYGLPMLSFNAVSASYIKLFIKSSVEKALALIILIFSIPILILFGIIIKCTSIGPVFFMQRRVGLRGRVFKQYKLRSMVINAEELQDQYRHLNEQIGPVFKIKDDPRLTRVGKFIRKYSIDELPQLYNVLKGDITLIGPRPLPVSEVKEFDKDFLHRRHSMKPGITGLWQVSGRNKVAFDKWVEMDLEYIDNWSFGLDMKIAIKTIGTVFSGSGM